MGELLAWVKEDENRHRGEMVLIVEGYKKPADDSAVSPEVVRTLNLLQKELPLKRRLQSRLKFMVSRKICCIS